MENFIGYQILENSNHIINKKDKVFFLIKLLTLSFTSKYYKCFPNIHQNFYHYSALHNLKF